MSKLLKKAFVKQLDERGEGIAVFATLDVIDHDGDVIVHGAIGEQEVKILPTHSWMAIPLGKGMTFEEGDQVLCKFRLNLETQDGADWHSAIKFDLEHGTPIQEWSFGFGVLEQETEIRDGERVNLLKRLDVHEVSPVVLGAGIGTQTLALKARMQEDGEGKKGFKQFSDMFLNDRIGASIIKCFDAHKTEASPDSWDEAANLKNLDKVTDNAKAFAAEEDGGSKSFLLHHFIDEKGAAGDASIRACMTGIAQLNGGRGGSDLTGDDRQKAYDHLAEHLTDAGVEAPKLLDEKSNTLRLADHISFSLWDVEGALARAKGLLELRRKEGRTLSSERYDELAHAWASMEQLKKLQGEIENLFEQADDPLIGEKLLNQFLVTGMKIDHHLKG